MNTDIEIIKEVEPVIDINFKEVKDALVETMEKYQNIVVTEDSLKGCKETQKELAGMRRKIDTYRKEKKALLSNPIVKFEYQCKELIRLITETEQPIKDGIEFYDNQRRDEKRKDAEVMAAEVVDEIGLDESYAKQLTILDKYCNLTAKKTDVKNDLTMRAVALKNEQDKEAELLKIMLDTLAHENERLKNKIQPSEFAEMYKRGYTASELVIKIKDRADEIYKIENEPAESETQPDPEEKQQEEIKEPVSSQSQETSNEQYYAIYRITGTVEQLRSISAYLKNVNIVYDVEKQGRVI